MKLEVIIPISNPLESLLATARSLADQTDRTFTVEIGGNCSKKGTEHIERATAVLQSANIETRTIYSSRELNRIELWNWLHFQSAADWLKPLLVGERLDSSYIKKLRAAAMAQPTAGSVLAGNGWFSRKRSAFDKNIFLGQGFYSPSEARALLLRYGPRFISPSTMAYDRNAFISVGGYVASFSYLSAALLAMTLAGTYGVAVIEEHLCDCGVDQVSGCRVEFATACYLLAYHAWTDSFPFSRSAFAWMWLRRLVCGGFR